MLEQYISLIGKIKKIKNWVLDILFPVQELPKNLKLNQTLFCSVCRARLALNKKICHRDARYLLGAATSYDNEDVKRLIWQLKYRGRTGNTVFLATLLSNYLKSLNFNLKNYAIVPVPLSQKRERQRGFNQAHLIAKIVAANFNLPLNNAAISKTKDTPPQAEAKDWEERKKNLENCFSVIKPDEVAGKNLIILDDVFTSGATLNEVARALKSAGAKKILGLVVAKAG